MELQRILPTIFEYYTNKIKISEVSKNFYSKQNSNNLITSETSQSPYLSTMKEINL